MWDLLKLIKVQLQKLINYIKLWFTKPEMDNQEADPATPYDKFSAGEIGATIATVIAIFFVCRGLFANYERNDYAGLIEFNTLMSSPDVIWISTLQAISSVIFAAYLTMLFYSSKKIAHYTFRQKIIYAVVFLFCFLQVLYGWFKPFYSVPLLDKAFPIVVLVEFFIFTIAGLIIYRHKFTPLGHFIGTFTTVMLFLSVILINYVNLSSERKGYIISIEGIDKELEYAIRYGDMMVVRAVGENGKRIIPISRFIEAKEKPKVIENSDRFNVFININTCK